MAHESNSEERKHKVRGRPFPKGNIRGKPKHDVLAIERPPSSDTGATIVLAGGVYALPEGTPISTLVVNSEEDKKLQKIESLEFKNGENTLTIRFSKTNNRLFRVQVFLNEETEIRPMSLSGSSSGYSFWNLLKKALKG